MENKGHKNYFKKEDEFLSKFLGLILMFFGILLVVSGIIHLVKSLIEN